MEELKKKINSALVLIESICDLVTNDLKINGNSLSKLDIARTSLIEFRSDFLLSKQDLDAFELNNYKKELIVKREDIVNDSKSHVKKIKSVILDDLAITNGEEDIHSDDDYIPDFNDDDPMDDHLEPKVGIIPHNHN